MALLNAGVLSSRRSGFDKLKGSSRSKISGDEPLTEEQKTDTELMSLHNDPRKWAAPSSITGDFAGASADKAGLSTQEKGVLSEAKSRSDVNQEIDNDRKGTMANIIGSVALTAAVLSQRKGGKPGQSRVSAHVGSASNSNLLGGGGVRKYLTPIRGSSRKISGYF